MSADTGRLLAFITVSVILHAAMFAAAGPESLQFSTAPAGEHHEVSVRLEAAAPAGAAADGRESETDEAPEVEQAEPESRSSPPEPARVAEIDAPPEPSNEPERDSIDTDESESEPSDEKSTDNTSEPAEQSGQDEREVVEETISEPEPAERVAEVDDSATGTDSTSSQAQRSEVREAIAAELAKHFRYPRLAQKRGWEGTVVLSVRILPDGSLDEIRVSRSSGRSVLDRSARRALAGVERLPEFADQIGEDGLALEIPVTYRLESA